MQLISGTPLKQLAVTEKTGDIVLDFESGTRLEVFNDSGGYEGWNCVTSSGFQLIGMGGGGTAYLDARKPKT